MCFGVGYRVGGQGITRGGEERRGGVVMPLRWGQEPVDLVCLTHRASCLSASTSTPVTARGEGGRGASPPAPSSVDRPRNKSILLRANWSPAMTAVNESAKHLK